jgi:PKD repeat protein
MLWNAPSMVAVRSLFLALALLLALAAPAVAAPDPSFIVSPDPPVAGLPATFTSTTTPPIVAPATRVVEWDFDGDDVFEAQGEVVTHTYASPGEKTFRMRVTDFPGGETTTEGETATESFTITVSAPLPANRPPVAQFRFSPTSPLLGQEVLFESLSYDRDGSIASYEWDFDGDGFDDGNTARVAHAFDSTGEQVVRLRVTDDSGAPSAVATETVTVSPPLGNRLPVAQFSISDLEPEVGQQISLRSFSYDPDGTVTAQRWDLDGDGDFDENATGRTAFTTFLQAGPKILRLRVDDSSGAFQTETVNITVKKRPRSTPSLMNPFPVIRFAGTVTARGARVRTLEVRAPRRSKITVRCAGKSCPAKRFTKTSATRRVRFKRMARFLKAGTVITVAVRKGNLIGKHTRWLVRGGQIPKRKDLCLYPQRSKPARCPRL